MGGTLGLGEAGRGGAGGGEPASMAGCSGSGDGPGAFQRLGMAVTWSRGRDEAPQEAASPSWEAILQGEACSDSSLSSSCTLIRSEEECPLSKGRWNGCIPPSVRRGPARTGSAVPRGLVWRPVSGAASVSWGLRARLSEEHPPLPRKPRPRLEGPRPRGLSPLYLSPGVFEPVTSPSPCPRGARPRPEVLE